jgi:hypothetical protein
MAESKTRHVDSHDEAAKQQCHGNKQFLPHHALTANRPIDANMHFWVVVAFVYN